MAKEWLLFHLVSQQKEMDLGFIVIWIIWGKGKADVRFDRKASTLPFRVSFEQQLPRIHINASSLLGLFSD